MRRALLFVLVLAAPSAMACPITVTYPLKYDFKRAPAVFEGTLERVDEGAGMYYFRVEKRWKGPPAETYAVSNPPTSCRFTLLRKIDRM